MVRARKTQPEATMLFLPSKRDAIVLALLGIAALGAALYLRYFIIQNTPLGLACDEDGASLLCRFRLWVILGFVFSVYGWGAMIAAVLQLWRPNVYLFGTGLVFSLLGVVLYNTRISALAIALLLLSLARPWREAE